VVLPSRPLNANPLCRLIGPLLDDSPKRMLYCRQPPTRLLTRPNR